MARHAAVKWQTMENKPGAGGDSSQIHCVLLRPIKPAGEFNPPVLGFYAYQVPDTNIFVVVSLIEVFHE